MTYDLLKPLSTHLIVQHVEEVPPTSSVMVMQKGGKNQHKTNCLRHRMNQDWRRNN